MNKRKCENLKERVNALEPKESTKKPFNGQEFAEAVRGALDVLAPDSKGAHVDFFESLIGKAANGGYKGAEEYVDALTVEETHALTSLICAVRNEQDNIRDLRRFPSSNR